MNFYLSLLRGINVSGQKLLSMASLQTCYEQIALKEVNTYIQTGNVYFTDPAARTPEVLNSEIEAELFKTYHFTVQSLLISADMLKTIVAQNPYAPEHDKKELYCTFLWRMPTEDALHELVIPEVTDSYALGEQVLYIHCPTGYGKTKFNNNFIEKKLKTTATTRNWNTVETLLKLIENKTNH